MHLNDLIVEYHISWSYLHETISHLAIKIFSFIQHYILFAFQDAISELSLLASV